MAALAPSFSPFYFATLAPSLMCRIVRVFTPVSDTEKEKKSRSIVSIMISTRRQPKLERLTRYGVGVMEACEERAALYGLETKLFKLMYRGRQNAVGRVAASPSGACKANGDKRLALTLASRGRRRGPMDRVRRTYSAGRRCRGRKPRGGVCCAPGRRP